MATKKVKKIKNSKRLKKLAPEELEDIWDAEVSESWNKLTPQKQQFLVQWLSNGYNASQAYKDVYNGEAKDTVAAASGHRMLSNVYIQTICGKLSNNNKTELISIKKVFTDALTADTPIFGDGNHIMDVEDHKTRILAANSLAKLNGELLEKADRDPKPPVTVIINEAQRDDIDNFLEATGQPPLKSTPVEAKGVKIPAVMRKAYDEDLKSLEGEEEVVFTSVGDNGLDVVD